MTRPAAKDTAIVIPARNEEARIGACLTALAGQGNAVVILVLNNTTDRTGSVAHDIAARHDLDLAVLERTLPSGVGAAPPGGSDVITPCRLCPRCATF